MSAWNKTSDGFPTHEKPVLVSNGKWIQAALATYVVADEGEGWIWEVLEFYNPTLNDVGSYCWDDDYDFDYWMEMPGLPEMNDEQGQKEAFQAK